MAMILSPATKEIPAMCKFCPAVLLSSVLRKQNSSHLLLWLYFLLWYFSMDCNIKAVPLCSDQGLVNSLGKYFCKYCQSHQPCG